MADITTYVTLNTPQKITGKKTFTKPVTIPAPADDDNSNAPATTAYCQKLLSPLKDKDAAISKELTTLEGFAEAREEADSAFQDDINAAYEALAAEYVKNGGTL